MTAERTVHDGVIDDQWSDDVDLAEHDEKEDLPEPPRYEVVFLNDDDTTADFVVDVLIRRFRHDVPTAVDIMLTVHTTGSAIAGTYSRDVAETLAALTMGDARAAGYPLRVTSFPSP
jgi:ATP-dependent Clp protease adaptor protein ClpS